MAWGVLNNRREGVWQQTAKGPCEGCEAALARAEARAKAAERELEKRPSLDEYLAEKDWAEKCEARAKAAERRLEANEGQAARLSDALDRERATLAAVRYRLTGIDQADPSVIRLALAEALAILDGEGEL